MAIRSRRRVHSLPLTPALVALATLVPGCSKEAEIPLRQRLFDQMEFAQLDKGGLEDEELPAERSWTFGFDDGLPEHAFARVERRDLVWEESPAQRGEEGLRGGALQLGPGLESDASRVALVFPATGFARVEVRARVRVDGAEGLDAQSVREALRVVEHTTEAVVPSDVDVRTRRRLRTQRVARRIDPSGWDRLETSFITRATTRALEVDLLHRTRGDANAVSRFDELEVVVTPLGQAGLLAEIARSNRPNDGAEDTTPWRVRVTLEGTVKDAVLLAAPATLTVPVGVPAAEHAPQLRFDVGMPREALDAPGDGLELEVVFEDREGESTVLDTVALDPKNDREERGWHERRVDLTALADRRGALAFRVRDAAGTEADALDLLALANPRIEPLATEPEAFNVLLIGVDTLRPDRMSAFGWERDTTPRLRELADRGVRFPVTRAQAPWTLPSFSSILTSLYPSQHGAGRGGHDEWTPIDPTTTSLAEVLHAEGYETWGLVSNGLISPRYGLDQGFESYHSAWGMESATRDADAVVEFVSSRGATPWLAFWHIMDPHLPYTTPPELRERFTDAEYDGRFARGRQPSVPFQDLDPRPGRRWFTHEGPPPPPDLTEADAEFVAGYYDAELFEMDAAVGRVFDALAESGQADRTIVAFVADHGEGLGDHGHYHHGYTLFEDQVRIPMILAIPGRDAGRVVERPVASIDLAPTLFGALGLPVPDSFEGVDRLAADAPQDDAYVLEMPTYDSSAQKAVILGDFKYLHDPVFRTEALYDLGSDPGEQVDVRAEHPDVVRSARATLDEFRWEMLQKGRYHLAVKGSPGDVLSLEIETDDLFDANFVARPAPPEEAFAMDLERKRLTLATELDASGALELVFWCRGTVLTLGATLGGEPLRVEVEGHGALDGGRIALTDVATAASEDVTPPPRGGARLWLEAGVAPVEAVVNTPEEIERLQDLGYAR